MKKLLSLLLVSIFLVSCGGSKWSCKKRYAQTKNMKEQSIMQPDLTMVYIQEIDTAEL